MGHESIEPTDAAPQPKYTEDGVAFLKHQRRNTVFSNTWEVRTGDSDLPALWDCAEAWDNLKMAADGQNLILTKNMPFGKKQS